MRLTTKQAAAAAAALATIAVLVSACNDGAVDQASAGDDPETSTPSPSQPPTPSPSDWTPLPSEGGDELLRPGRYGLTANGDEGHELPWAVVEVPSGAFSSFGEWAILGEGRESGGSVSYWVLSDVQRDPCEPGDIVEVKSVEDAVDAFVKQQRTKVTVPAPLTLDGYRGVYLELRVPNSTDFEACPEYNLWGDGTDAGRYAQSPGTERVWILDLAGELAVLQGGSSAGDRAPERHRIVEMAESVKFIPRD